MMMPQPFVYPNQPHIRKHAPAGYKDYGDYKPWLRDEFEFRCVYSLHREMWTRDRHAAFSVEHVIPQSEDSTLICVYTNLAYACLRCNSARQEIRILDPTKEALAMHVRVEADGSITGLSAEGIFLIKLLHLNEGSAPKERRRILRLLDRRQQFPDHKGVETDFLEAFGYPEDLPELRTKRPPGGNLFEANTAQCFLARREKNQLPSIY